MKFLVTEALIVSPIHNRMALSYGSLASVNLVLVFVWGTNGSVSLVKQFHVPSSITPVSIPIH